MKRILRNFHDVIPEVVPETAKEPEGRDIGDLVLIAFRIVTPVPQDPMKRTTYPPKPHIVYGKEVAGITRAGEWDLVNCISIPVERALSRYSGEFWMPYEADKSRIAHVYPDGLRIGDYLDDDIQGVVAVGQDAVESYFLLGREEFFESPRILEGTTEVVSFYGAGVRDYIDFCEQFGTEPTARSKEAERKISREEVQNIARTDWARLRTDQIGVRVNELKRISRRHPDILVTQNLTIAQYRILLEGTLSLGGSYERSLRDLNVVREQISK